MKFKVNRDHFSHGLQQVLNVVGTRATMPILGHVLLEAKDGRIALTTTNLDLGIRCSIAGEVETEGTLTLPVRKLSTIVRELPNLDVELDASGGTQAKISSGRSTFRLMGLSPEEFPPLPQFDDERSYTLSQEDLARMLKSVSYAQSQDETRYIMNGVFFAFEEARLTTAATDGRRLAVVHQEMEVPDDRAGSLILPAKTVGEVERLLGQGAEARIVFNERQVKFEIETDGEKGTSGLQGAIHLVSKLVEGNYPNYRQVIPKESDQRIRVERELLLECVKRAALVTSDRSLAVRLKISENLLEISGSSPDLGESHESVAIAYEGPEVQVAFNPQFLMEPLRNIATDEVFLEFKDELSPGVFKTMDSFLCVVMPLRLN